MYIVALSTTAAEYITLSQSTHDLFPMHGLLQEFSKATKLIVGSTIAHSTIFEDNKGCVELANAPKMRPTTCHIALKYHRFCSHIENGNISIQWIDTKHQLADIFTKPLAASYSSPSILFRLVTFTIEGVLRYLYLCFSVEIAPYMQCNSFQLKKFSFVACQRLPDCLFLSFCLGSHIA